MKGIKLICSLLAAIIAVISGILTIVTQADPLFTQFPDWVRKVSIVAFFGLGIFLIVGCILEYCAARRKSVRQHKFQYQSADFIKFFADWYRQPGTLSIISRDLDWVKTSTNSDIYEQLVNKCNGKHLRLLLGKEGIQSEIAQELKEKGASVELAPENIVSAYTLSCLPVLEDVAGQVIVRYKPRNSSHNDVSNAREVIFEEITNTYVTDLLTALLTKEG